MTAPAIVIPIADGNVQISFSSLAQAEHLLQALASG